jgi:hypothetical protein
MVVVAETIGGKARYTYSTAINEKIGSSEQSLQATISRCKNRVKADKIFVLFNCYHVAGKAFCRSP